LGGFIANNCRGGWGGDATSVMSGAIEGRRTEESDEKESCCVWKGGRQERSQHGMVRKKAKRGRAISLSQELKLGQCKLEMYFGLKERIRKMVFLCPNIRLYCSTCVNVSRLLFLKPRLHHL
jgi:hypothetical protein